MAPRQPRQGGLGNVGRGRVRENIGRPQQTGLGETVFRGSAPLESSQPLRTPWISVDSTRIDSYLYDYSTGSLYLRWKNNGTVWVYEDVSTAVFETFTSAPSMGRYVNSTLNVHFYHKVFEGDIE